MAAFDLVTGHHSTVSQVMLCFMHQRTSLEGPNSPIWQVGWSRLRKRILAEMVHVKARQEIFKDPNYWLALALPQAT
jgi:hypothetical protein